MTRITCILIFLVTFCVAEDHDGGGLLRDFDKIRVLTDDAYRQERDAILLRTTPGELRKLADALPWQPTPEQWMELPKSTRGIPLRWWVEALWAQMRDREIAIIARTAWHPLGAVGPILLAPISKSGDRKMPAIEDVGSGEFDWLNPVDAVNTPAIAIANALGRDALPLIVENQFNRLTLNEPGQFRPIDIQDTSTSLIVLADDRCVPMLVLLSGCAQSDGARQWPVKVRLKALHRLADLVVGLPEYKLVPEFETWKDAELIRRRAVTRTLPATTPLRGDALNATIRAFTLALNDPHPGVRVAAACELARFPGGIPASGLASLKESSLPTNDSLPWSRAWKLVILSQYPDPEVQAWAKDTAARDPDKDVAVGVADSSRLRPRRLGAPVAELIPFGVQTLNVEPKKP